ncbi:MAG: LamB/YcsF family protein [Phycisphaerales bacterium]|nr:MAG: LamB/YcsF family protein [Phycisphaerales bacterium]
MNPARAPNPSIDLNADIGERDADGSDATAEAALGTLVTSVNIACGGHAGNERTMRAAVRRAAAHACAIGAHPAYPDREGFGRRTVPIPADTLSETLTTQIGALARIASDAGAGLRHVKPHGSLYHDASTHEAIARAIMDAARAHDPALRLIGPAASQAVRWWRAWGARVGEEGFVDRVYEADGRLRDRDRPGALLRTPDKAAAQAVQIATRGTATASDGSTVRVPAQTLCLHADTPDAVAIAERVGRALQGVGVTLRALDHTAS